MKKNIYREELPKRGGGGQTGCRVNAGGGGGGEKIGGGAQTVCRFNAGGGGLVKNRAGVFLRGEVDTSMHTMKLAVTLTVILIYWCQCLRG